MIENSDSNSSSSLDSSFNTIFYEGKQLLNARRKEEAMGKFQNVIDNERKKSRWGFDCLVEMIKIHCSLNNYDKAKSFYENLFEYVPSAVTFNYSEECITELLDYFANLPEIKNSL